MAKLTLTPDMLESTYEYLRVSPPFCRWGLPHADHVMFRVLGAKDRYGHFRGRHRKARGDDFSEIAISAGLVKTTDLLLSTMAHEMIHLHQHEKGGCTRGPHNAHFRRLAARAADDLAAILSQTPEAVAGRAAPAAGAIAATVVTPAGGLPAAASAFR